METRESITEVQPQEHLIVALVRHFTKRGADEPYVLDETALETLKIALLDHAEDPTLPSAIVGLFDIATWLHSAGAPGAALGLLRTLHEVRPKLSAIQPGMDRFMEDASERCGALIGAAEKSCALLGPPPEGALKVTSLEGFRDQALRGGRIHKPRSSKR